MKRKTLDIVYCGIFATITAILAQISIPLPGGVPLTLQTFAVSLAGILLGSKKGFISILVYVLMGAIGLPVFSGFSGGIGASSNMYNAFLVCVLPFILVGVIKAVLATIIGSMLRNHKSIRGIISYDKA